MRICLCGPGGECLSIVPAPSPEFVHRWQGRRVWDFAAWPDVVRSHFEIALGGESVEGFSPAVAGKYRIWYRTCWVPTNLREAPVACIAWRLRDGYDRLTARQRKVIDVLKASSSPSVAARALGISPHTLQAHRRAIMATCDIETSQEFAVFVALHGRDDSGDGTGWNGT